MAVKIKSLNAKKKKRKCFLCDKIKDMEFNERFCSSVCRNVAKEIGKYGNEFKVTLR